jgi:hypothetical protein
VPHDAWCNIQHDFWLLAKDTDDRTTDEAFDDKFKDLVAAIKDGARKRFGDNYHRKLELAVRWLEALREKKKQWAYRYTWRQFTAGCHSTQRAESIHQAAKVTYITYNHILLL